MIDLLNKIPSGYRKFIIVFTALLIFLFLSGVTFLIKTPEGQALVIGSIAAGLVSIITVFFKYNKDVHVDGKAENEAK